ncbi:ERF family protein [Spiroplasma phoeniceum]|uniref:Prophage recombination protein n=1 Tax=Spiroplasma phoeniceum P40 TaxID=1276259 RepID=A0A345DS16_9MOLU|nr:ERF family protein [Spiroplasma phoeniceum]AXF95755.1 putative prophage recombination protein [Spiroplasma phoeniceum P40]AXF97007.1 putative prophage recombination protein [Spiroplasma phoeniceum P40]AXF97036.1 putative prophage recombination protein [Spiroplasma phoeniceum P40]AXF97074.1 putative prophage recombination protein [Spiroplasma phoeniceum P40]
MPQETKTKTLIESIGEIQSDINLFVGKNARNDHNNYNYFTESDLYQTLKPQLRKQGITYTIQAVGEPSFTETQSSKGGKLINYYSKGLLTLYKGSEKIELGIILSAQNSDIAKAIGSALTYGARYWLCKTFGIATDELDPDSTEISKENSNQVIKENNNPNSMSLEHFNNIKNFITNTKIDINIKEEAKKFIKETTSATKLEPVIIKKQSEDFYYQFKERFLK